MPTIGIDTGHVNLRTASARVLLWHCPRRGEGEEMVISGAAKQTSRPEVTAASGWAQPRPSVMLPTQGGGSTPGGFDVYGQMTAASYTVASGTIFKLFMQRNEPWTMRPIGLAAAAAVGGVCACQYYRVREGAAVVTIKVKMLTDARCPTQHATLTGPFEALTVQEAIAAGVAAPKAHFLKLFAPALVQQFIGSVTVVAAATTSVATVVTPAGQEVSVVTPVKRRRAVFTSAD